MTNPTTARHRVLLDTDLGSDVDDAYALACLVGSPDVSLVGVTTVYGDTLLRARLTRRLLGLMGRDTDCVPGVAQPLSGADIWLSGEEGYGHPNLDDELVLQGTSAPDYLIEQVLAAPGEIDVLAIGPLTNIAIAIQRAPAFATAMRTLWVMGGRFDSFDEIEHNFRSDAEAARVVFDSSARVICVGVEITRQVKLWDDQITQIGQSGDFGSVLERDTRRWIARWNEEFDCPHDAVLVVSMLERNHFEFRTGHVTVRAGGPEQGRTSFAERADGRHLIAASADVHAIAAKIMSLVRVAAAGPR